jgi:spore coat polysaccharide biosynthesis protein SpsF (cytidylyltransferase family)
MSVVCIIQARLNSTRLPRKILEPIGPWSMLEHCYFRVAQSKLVDTIVVAVPAKDKELVDYCTERRWNVYAGSGNENDVLKRYWLAAKAYKANVIVRATSDCAFLDPNVIDAAIAKFQKGSYDLVGMDIEDNRWPHGLQVEVLTKKALRQAHLLCEDTYQREHVTLFLRDTPGYNLGHMRLDQDLSHIRITVDTPEDLLRAREIVEHYGRPNVTTREIITYLEGK